ncbi:phage tail tape measure protein [Yersinia ruckeri]|uniref:phage tail tape measure protein n=1 Tax=Yersinia ruckeri TaxID=29486 RepID=UPI001F237AD4|nr:phage tail tape measure protein [Yersinia ruckeri]UIM99423.1 phage tail tape measure protein [Yersinia ruckeri]
MSKNLQLQVLLKAVDNATRPLRGIQAASKSLAGEMKTTKDTLKSLEAQAAKVEGFRKASAQLAVTGQALKKAKDEAAALAIKFKDTEKPTAQQARLMESAKRAATELQTKYNGLRQSVQRQRDALNADGIATKNLSSEQRRLRSSATEATNALIRQRQELEKLSAKQTQKKRSGERRQAGKELAANVRNTSAAGLGVATAGLFAETKLLAPGIQFDKQMSDTQATLGLDKSDKTMAAIRQQARDIGATTAFSPTDVARTQSTLARSGYDGGAILKSTEATVNLSLASGVDIAEAADIVTNMQSAFNLPLDQIQRVTDVMTKGFTSSNSNLQDFGEAMKYVAPIAEAAGASIEDTTAMLGVLADNGIKGSMAGTGASAMFTRLQAPAAQAHAALAELKVKTKDSKGDMLPMEKILKDINRSFKVNKLGRSQKAEYLKVIFGEEALKGAVKLVAAAGDGKLAKKKEEVTHSAGTTAAIAKVKTDNLDGDLKNLSSAWEDVRIEVFDGQNSALRKLTVSATGWLSKASQWTKANPKLTGSIMKLVIGATALIGGLALLGLLAAPVIAGFSMLLSPLMGVGKAILWLGRIAMANPLIAILGLVAMAAIYIWQNWDTLVPKFKALWDTISNGTVAIWNKITAWLAEKWEAITSLLSTTWGKITTWLKNKWDSFTQWLSAKCGGIVDAAKAIPEQLKAAGVAMIDNLLEGINSKWEELKNKFASMTDFMPKLRFFGDDEANSLPPPPLGLGGANPTISPNPWYAGQFDTGGNIPKGQFGIVGERGPEIINGPAHITSRRKTAALSAVGAMALTLPVMSPVASIEPANVPMEIRALSRPSVPATAPPASAASQPPANIYIYPQPGQDAQQIGREVARQLEALQRKQAAAVRSRMA